METDQLRRIKPVLSFARAGWICVGLMAFCFRGMCAGAQEADMHVQYGDFLLLNDKSWVVGKSMTIRVHQEGTSVNAADSNSSGDSLARILEAQFLGRQFRTEEYQEFGKDDQNSIRTYAAFDGSKFVETQSPMSAPIKIYAAPTKDFRSIGTILTAFGLVDSAVVSESMGVVEYDAKDLVLVTADKITGSNKVRQQFQVGENGALYLARVESFLGDRLSVERVYSNWQPSAEAGVPSRPCKCIEKIYDLTTGELRVTNVYEVLKTEALPDSYEIPAIPLPKGKWVSDYRTEPELNYQYQSVGTSELNLEDLKQNLDTLDQNSKAVAPSVDWPALERAADPMSPDHYTRNTDSSDPIVIRPFRLLGLAGLLSCAIVYIVQKYRRKGSGAQ